MMGSGKRPASSPAAAFESKKTRYSWMRGGDFDFAEAPKPKQTAPGGRSSDQSSSAPPGPFSQSRDRRRPPRLEFKDKVPREDRINFLITPRDQDFVNMLQYFDKLLRQDNLSVKEILDAHFTSHEVSKIVPTTKEPIATWQKQDAARFQELLETQFKGVLPTLKMKLTMYYFGLPVAPLKVIFCNEPPDPLDLDDFDGQDKSIPRDPLEFLDEYVTRVHEPEPGSTQPMPPIPGNWPLSLRGGVLDQEEMDLILSDIEEEESVIWERQANDQLQVSLRGGALDYDEVSAIAQEDPNTPKTPNNKKDGHLTMYGRQGHIDYGRKWVDFVLAAKFLLGDAAATGHQVQVAIDLFDKQRDHSFKYVSTVEGSLLLDPKSYEEKQNDVIKTFMTNNMTPNHAKEYNRVCFVRLVRDQRPSTPKPQVKPGSGIVELTESTGCDTEPRRTTYLRITKAPSQHNWPSQYFYEFKRAIYSLHPEAQHHYLGLRHTIKNEDYGKLYVAQDPPLVFTEGIAEFCDDEKADLEFSVTFEPICTNTIPVLTPGNMSLDPATPTVAGTVQKSALSDLGKLVDLAVNACVPDIGLRGTIQSVELWLHAQTFFDDARLPFSTGYEDGKPTPASREMWNNYINGFKVSNPAIYQSGFGIMARPLFKEYRLLAEGRAAHLVRNFLSLDLNAFKALVSVHLYPQAYDVFDTNHVLRLSTPSIASQHAVRFDTKPEEWARIKRRITESVIVVAVETGPKKYEWQEDTKWDLCGSSYWGPCYDVPKDFNLDLAMGSASKSSRLDGSAQGKPKVKFDLGGAGNDVTDITMRDQTYWQPPSIFANPYKPAMPLHAPPVESMLRVGDSMPAVSLAMRTPAEMARLQHEVHTLRGQLLDRIRDCPYADCDQCFHYRDQDGLDRHLKEDHTILRCPFCHVSGCYDHETESALYFADRDRALQHFYDKHWTEFLGHANVPVDADGKLAIGQFPSVVVGNAARERLVADYKFCHRCGRDNSLCHGAEDREHHRHSCINKDFEDPTKLGGETPEIIKWCRYCGDKYPGKSGVCLNDDCIEKAENRPQKLEQKFCASCGIPFAGWSQTSQATHKMGCKTPGGKTWDFCGFCGIDQAGVDDTSRRSHANWCELRPKPTPTPCPGCGDLYGTFKGPEEILEHLDAVHKQSDDCPWCEQIFPSNDHIWLPDVKIQHFAKHMGQVAKAVPGASTGDRVLVGQERCPNWHTCGVIIGSMTDKQYQLHVDQAHGGRRERIVPYKPNGHPNVVNPRPRNEEIQQTNGTSDGTDGNIQDIADLHVRPVMSVNLTRPPRGSKENPRLTDLGRPTIKFQWRFNGVQNMTEPNWMKLEPYQGDERTYLPEPTRRCSRCFKPAPATTDKNRSFEIKLHSDPRYSCRIRRAPGIYNPGAGCDVPNSSGWIEFPPDFDFKQARQSFLARHIAYAGTIFPVDDERADDIYDGPQPNRGQSRDDVMANSLTEAAMARHQLPWPPYKGPGTYQRVDIPGQPVIHVPAFPAFQDVDVVGSSTRRATAAIENSQLGKTKIPNKTGPTSVTKTAIMNSAKLAEQSARGSTAQDYAAKSTGQSTRGSTAQADFGVDENGDVDGDISMSSDSDIETQMPDSVIPESLRRSSKKRQWPSDIDPLYRRGSRDDEPEEEFDDRSTQRDGVAEDFSTVPLDAEAISPSWNSPKEANFPKNKGRPSRKTPLVTVSKAQSEEPPVKRVKKSATSSRGTTPLAGGEAGPPGQAARNRARSATPAVEPKQPPATTGRATPGPRSRGMASQADDYGPEGPTRFTPTPGTLDTLPSLPTTERKSSRVLKPIKKVTYEDESVSEEDVQDARAAASEAGPAKTPAKRARKKAGEDGEPSTVTKATRTPARTPAKTPTRTPGTRSRKRVEVDCEPDINDQTGGQDDDGTKPKKRVPRIK
ncbi:hypothetical protein JX266_013725 [Neoarthrinium moseri]|nr:hypothetical protein JX266_013725 [Neoarthrinium moseri]